MQGMVPEKGDTGVSIPITFDLKVNRDNLSIFKMVLGLLITIGGFVAMVLVFIIAEDKYKPLLPLILGFGTFYFVRLFFLKERFYTKKRADLIEHDYTYSTHAFWGIYSINEYFPYICKMANGRYAIFVAFDKDIIIGRDNNADYDHYEAISNAYSVMLSKDISAVHIDYADVVGKDSRMDSLFAGLTNTENKDLMRETIRLYDYVQSYMYRAYADYDVYAFYYSGREETFWEDLQPVLDAFLQANYVRSRVLSREDIGDLCVTLMNLTDFSTARASERVFLGSVRGGSFLKVIWTEKDGERTEVNRTRDEIAAERRVRAAENVVRENQRRLRRRKKRGTSVDLSRDLFDEVEVNDTDTGVVDLFED